MFVNELGRLTGLERNEAATIIYRRNTLYHKPGQHQPEDLDWIAGPAVLFEHQVWKWTVEQWKATGGRGP
jgi:hypothetical protein